MLLLQSWNMNSIKSTKEKNKDIYIKNTNNGQISKTY